MKGEHVHEWKIVQTKKVNITTCMSKSTVVEVLKICERCKCYKEETYTKLREE